MTAPVKFGRQAAERPAFTINGREFQATPLSLREEKHLAATELDGAAGDIIEAMLGILAQILGERSASSEPVTVAWLMENLSAADLEGIVQYLRGEEE